MAKERRPEQRRRPAPRARAPQQQDGPIRLQKAMAAAGYASRRASEELIRAGRVTVNGRTATLGTKVTPGGDTVAIDGVAMDRPEALAYVAANKPRGMVTTLYDPRGRPTVADLVRDVPVRVFPVGRLDYDTDGLLLLTNDGELAHALMHPARHVWKTYIATVRGAPAAAKLRAMAAGLELDDGPTAPARVRLLRVLGGRDRGGQLAAVEVAIHEGRKRQVRRMFAAIGHEVIGLRRVSLASLRLGNLPPAGVRYLTLGEIHALRRSAGLAPEPDRPLLQPPNGRPDDRPNQRPSQRPDERPEERSVARGGKRPGAGANAPPRRPPPAARPGRVRRGR